MAKGNDSPYALMPEDKVVIRNMDFFKVRKGGYHASCWTLRSKLLVFEERL